MFALPCSTEECTADAAAGLQVCVVCHDRNGYAEGYSRARDAAWLDYRSCDEIARVPLVGPGCNSHPVTPLPDVCSRCLAVAA